MRLRSVSTIGSVRKVARRTKKSVAALNRGSRTGQGGGRAQEFALAAAGEIAGLSDIWVAGFATDGTDGPTSVAGAVVDGGTTLRAQRAKLNLSRALWENDAYPFFKKLGGHIVTGPTGTNVNDLYLLLAL